jgi:hypothetical protein
VFQYFLLKSNRYAIAFSFSDCIQILFLVRDCISLPHRNYLSVKIIYGFDLLFHSQHAIHFKYSFARRINYILV